MATPKGRPAVSPAGAAGFANARCESEIHSTADTATQSKPPIHQGDLRHLHPAIVKRLVPLPNWVAWKWELNEKQTGWTKVPYQPQRPASKAATNDKKTWGTYADAVAAVEAGKADGIGFVLTETNICAFDIDCCRDASGKVDPIAANLMKRCGATYFEETVGGRGLRCIGLGGTTRTHRKQAINGSNVSIESYRWCERFITISNMVLDSVKPTMADLGNIDAVITVVVEELDGQGDVNSKSNDVNATPITNDDNVIINVNAFTEASLPNDLLNIIRNGVPITEDRSAAFYHAIKWLKDNGWQLGDVVATLARHPDGIASKYGKRVAAEAERAFNKADKAKTPGTGSNSDNRLPVHGEIAEELFRRLDLRGEDIRIVADEKGSEHIWIYRDGLWSLVLNATPWMDHQIEMTLREVKQCAVSGARFVMEVRKYIERSPNIRSADRIKWDDHGMIPTSSGLIDPVTLAIRPLRKEDYATWRLEIEYDPNATCPLFEETLDSYFASESKDEGDKRKDLLQEFMGTTLIDRKPKSLRRALTLHGPSDSGKSNLLRTMGGLLTDKPISTQLSELSGAHGLQEFSRRAPWVLDEAFDIGQWHLSSRVKSIIAGDMLSVNPKGISAITMRMRCPCIWATNHPPTFKENTDAMVNRLLILKLKRVFEKGEFVGVAAKAREINPAWEASDLILDREKPGLLNWALIGLQRLLKRGNFINTDEGNAALDEMKVEANPVAGFVRDCIYFNLDLMISTRDFHAAFTGWRQDNHGDDKANFSRSFVGRHLAALSHPLIGQDKETFREADGTRYYVGIGLNVEGSAHFDSVARVQNVKGDLAFDGISTCSADTKEVVPGKWRDSAEVKRIKKLLKERLTKEFKEGKVLFGPADTD
ncbi:DUF5906 domain-containing protein [Bradyrhizobium sp. A11]|uniref:DUF5906 domain-containing protein n=1 Tax=Bradyrhizobium sp. A11 TaxID=3133974 RepID=UPI003250CA6F